MKANKSYSTFQKKSKNRTVPQWIFIIIIAIFAVVTWFKNEEKAEQTKPKTAPATPSQTTQPTAKTTAARPAQNTLPPPSSLGFYDTVMANDNLGQNKHAKVDYYQLALSWSPSFCELQKHKNDGNTPKHLQYQCNSADQFGWVIHGLWPQAANARDAADHPRFCQGDLPPVSEDLIKQHLAESPGATLLQGQWEKHGACAFNSAESYFAKQKELFLGLTLPTEAMDRKSLFAWLKKHNPQLKNAYLGATKTELYICYDKQWNVMDCPRN